MKKKQFIRTKVHIRWFVSSSNVI